MRTKAGEHIFKIKQDFKNRLPNIIMFVKIAHMKLKKYLIPLICNSYISQNRYVT